MLKQLEIWGRRVLVLCLGWLMRARPRGVDLMSALMSAMPAGASSTTVKILVVRLDERLGNLLLLTPLLTALRAWFPEARIDVLAHARGRTILGDHPAVDRFVSFRKRALLAADGPLGCLVRLRRQRYTVAIDASNPTDPSATQAILLRLCGAAHSIGVDRPGFGRLYSAPVRLADPGAHEIDLRLQLLEPLRRRHGVVAPLPARLPVLGRLPRLPPDSAVARFRDDVAVMAGGVGFAILNVGARLRDKQLDPRAYAALGQCLLNAGFHVVITYGPHERPLAEQTGVMLARERCRLAPESGVIELAHLLRAARCVLTCDTGPMHLAVAVGTPTLGLFVSTDPQRYGYAEAPHTCIDARCAPIEEWLGDAQTWCDCVA